MSEVKEHPILFSGEMVRAILDGRKTMTRRVVKPQPYHENTSELCLEDSINNMRWKGKNDWPCPHNCPHGDIANRLWIREMWAAPHVYDHIPPRLIPCDVNFHFAADEERGGLLWRPSIHMPRWASRITLEITDVRVERLQEISEASAVKEGIRYPTCPIGTPREEFSYIWDRLNAKRGYGWDANPWVWVIEFKRVTA